MVTWPDCCRGRAIALSDDWLLDNTISSRHCRPSGMHRNAIAIASSSAVYGFWSSRGPRMTEYLATILSVWPDDLYATMPPIPTSHSLSEALVAITISLASLTAVIVASRSASHTSDTRLCHGGTV